MVRRPTTRHPAGLLTAVGVGVTWATNALGGHFVVPGLAAALVAPVYGVRHRTDLAGLLGVTGASALVTLAAAAVSG